jgi:IS4 transposase
MLHHKQNAYRAQVQQFKRKLLQIAGFSIQDLLPGDVLHKVIEKAHSVREQIYTPLVTLGLFLRQVLSADGSCKNAVAYFRVERAKAGAPTISVNTGPYCKARQRLPLEPLHELVQRSGTACDGQWSTPADLWRGLWRVKLVDGVTMQMQDTEDNQKAYPQPNQQKPGLGFPLVRMVALISLAVGTALDYALAPYQGKGTGEASLLGRLWNSLLRGDLLLGDRYYASYCILALLMGRGAAGLMRQHAGRKPDFRRGRRLGTRDHLILWSKPKVKPIWLSDEEFAALPAEMEVREFRARGAVYVTTLLNEKKYSKKDLAKLYEQRWKIELDLRSMKTYMGMEMLRCLTPEMVEKEIAVNLLAYNLIRSEMAQAAQRHGCNPRNLSFMATVQLYLNAAAQWGMEIIHNLRKLMENLLLAIAGTLVGIVKKDPQPRAVKRRPKPYPRLMRPRAVLKKRLLKEQNKRLEIQCAM